MSLAKRLKRLSLMAKWATGHEIIKEEKIHNGKYFKAKRGEDIVELHIIKMDKGHDNYINNKINELKNLKIRILGPYVPIEVEYKSLEEFVMKCYKEGIWYCLGYSDAEFSRVIYSKEQLIRYRYFITWRWFEELKTLIQLEFYIPQDMFNIKKIKQFVHSIMHIDKKFQVATGKDGG